MPSFQNHTLKPILFFALFILFLFLYTLSPFFDVLAWAAILSFFAYPVYKKINARLRRRRISAIVVLLGFVCFILLPLGLISLQFYQQFLALIEALKPLFNKDLSEIFEVLKHHKATSFVFSKVYSQLAPFIPLIQEKFSSLISSIFQFSFSFFGDFLRKTASISFKLAFTLITLYYFLIDGEKIFNTVKELIPATEKEKERIFERISSILKGVLYGNILTGILQGLLALIIYLILGIPQNLIWAFLTVVASFIPVLGTSLIWFPLVIYLLIGGHYIKALILFVYSLLLISQIDNIIKPILIGGRTKIHSLLIFFSVLGGLAKFGLLGLFLGPVIMGLFLSVLEIYRINLSGHARTSRSGDN